MNSADDHPIILFDGVCNLCNALVNFVIRRDPPPGQFKFASLQSQTGQDLLHRHGLPPDDLNTFVLIENNVAHLRSAAALRVLRLLGLPWSLLYPFIILPRAIRDPVYHFIARHRYRWFGKRDACMIPTDEFRSRFLD